MKILIATDGSEFGTTTIDFASRLIGNGAEVKLITVIEPAAGTELETIIESTDELTDPENPEVQRAAAMLRRSKERLLGKLEGVEAIVSGEVLAGPAPRTIVETAEAWKAELIIVGTHGQGFWRRTLIGSVSDRVLSHAHCSVVR